MIAPLLQQLESVAAGSVSNAISKQHNEKVQEHVSYISLDKINNSEKECGSCPLLHSQNIFTYVLKTISGADLKWNVKTVKRVSLSYECIISLFPC